VNNTITIHTLTDITDHRYDTHYGVGMVNKYSIHSKVTNTKN